MAKVRREINQEFLEYLEYKICKLYQQLRPREKMKLWCKEIAIMDSENYSIDSLNTHKKVLLKAFVEKYGRTEYDLNLNFGNQALSLYSKGLDLKNTFPGNRNKELFTIDFENKTITITLD